MSDINVSDSVVKKPMSDMGSTLLSTGIALLSVAVIIGMLVITYFFGPNVSAILAIVLAVVIATAEVRGSTETKHGVYLILLILVIFHLFGIVVWAAK